MSRRQLLAAGVSAAAIGRMLKRGSLLREHAGVYAVAHTAPMPLAHQTAALLACPDDAVLSHRSAAELWGLAPGSRGPVEITVPHERIGKPRSGITLRRTNRLRASDVRVHEGLPVTSPARTLLDFSGQASPHELERALDEAMSVLKLTTPAEVRDVIKRASGRKGGRLLAQLLDRRVAPKVTQSWAERRFLKLVRDARLPEPETQVSIAGYTVDFYWPEHRVAFEVDGYLFHTSRSAFDRDKRKDPALKAAGVDPNRVSGHQVKYEALTVIANVASALARARSHAPSAKRP